MSSSVVHVMQKKNDDTTVTWRDYEEIRDHLQGIFTRTTDRIEKDAQLTQLQLEETEKTINTIQRQVTNIQTSIQTLTQSVNGLRLLVEQQQHPHAKDDNANSNADNVATAPMIGTVVVMVREAVVVLMEVVGVTLPL